MLTTVFLFLCRFAAINRILRVSIGGVAYVFLKCDWLPIPTDSQIADFKRSNSILGVDKVSKAFYTFNPHNSSKYTMDTQEPFILATQVEAQVIISRHPCMDSAVVLDLTNRNKEKLARERLIGTDGHYESCGKCGYGGELLLCDKDGCKEAMHITCAGLVANPVENWYCSKCAV